MDYYKALIVLIVYLCLRTIYRLALHPLRGIPGPKLAASTSLYEFYYDAVKGGKYIWEVERMHRQYGPIVRISPREVHIKDPYFYDEIYTSSSIRKRDKDSKLVASFCAPTASFSTVDHNLHRSRRAVISHLFTRKAVVSHEFLIQDNVGKLASLLESIHKKGSVFSLKIAAAALISDVLAQYMYGTSTRYLDDPTFRSESVASATELASKIHILRHIPVIATIFQLLPLALLRPFRLLSDFCDFRLWLRKQSQDALQGKGGSTVRRGPVFDALLRANVPAEEKTLQRLEDESFTLFSAGSETVSQALSVIFFHLLKNAELIKTLRKELKQVMPMPTDLATWSELEKLPFLTAVITEALRLSGTSGRLPRVSPTEPLIYGKYIIPPGTPVGQSNYFAHRDPAMYPNPNAFDPYRWIHAEDENTNPKPFYAPFSKGSRQCIGINLAYATLYLTVATLIRRFDMEISDSTEDELRTARDFLIPFPEKGQAIVKARVKNVLTT
ncbi:hypothetical protein AnigIFM60653_001098 [Aspergillus niger]|nr:hypothetical protein AnigIFM50267_007928 [Aspergillus niger]GLA09967.1 hypothetical protein AnigIFM60653_001098 [Aspergillus niger]GLA15188.1 hypothetical protein AnigIFM62618_001701 [Aspergillus niger]